MATDNYLRQRAALLKKENEKLKAENERLKAEVTFLKRGVESAGNDADYWRSQWKVLHDEQQWNVANEYGERV